MAKVDYSQALDLKLNHGLNYPQIAKIQGVSTQAIHKKLQHFLPTQDTEEYKDKRADILAHTQLKLITQIDSKRLKKAQLRDLVVSAGILYDKERLERGQSTTNVDVHLERADLKTLEAEKRRVREELKSLGIDPDNPDRVTIVPGDPFLDYQDPESVMITGAEHKS